MRVGAAVYRACSPHAPHTPSRPLRFPARSLPRRPVTRASPSRPIRSPRPSCARSAALLQSRWRSQRRGETPATTAARRAAPRWPHPQGPRPDGPHRQGPHPDGHSDLREPGHTKIRVRTRGLPRCRTGGAARVCGHAQLNAHPLDHHAAGLPRGRASATPRSRCRCRVTRLRDPRCARAAPPGFRAARLRDHLVTPRRPPRRPTRPRRGWTPRACRRCATGGARRCAR